MGGAASPFRVRVVTIWRSSIAGADIEGAALYGVPVVLIGFNDAPARPATSKPCRSRPLATS